MERLTLFQKSNINCVMKLSKEEANQLAGDLGIDKDKLKDLQKKLAKIEPRAEKGVETFFRLISKNHYTLNTMVDSKSNIMISINAIILSIIIGTVMNKIAEDPHLAVPVVMMLVTNVASIIYAIFATRPELNHGTSQSVDSATNVLFYGNYQQLDEQEYVSKVSELMNSGDDLYHSISRDTYHLGKALDRKFRFLRISFNIFMIGIVLSVLAFISCHLFFGEAFAN